MFILLRQQIKMIDTSSFILQINPCHVNMHRVQNFFYCVNKQLEWQLQFVQPKMKSILNSVSINNIILGMWHNKYILNIYI